MRTLVLLSSLLLPLAAGATPELRPPSRIEAVTVHLGAARVTRRVRLEAPAGPSRVLLGGLPDVLLDDSIRVDGSGAARARVHGVSVERTARVTEDDPEARQVRERVEALELEDRALEDRKAAALARKALLESLKSTWVSERTENLAVRKADPKEWQALLDFTGRELAGILGDLRSIEVAKRELARRLEAARAELRSLEAKTRTFAKTVAVEVEADRAGALELEVTYVVPSATWAPVWDARLDPESGALAMELHATIRQTTGEDWDGVRLAVSTAQAMRNLRVPELHAAWLVLHQPARIQSRGLGAAPAAARAKRLESAAEDEDHEAHADSAAAPPPPLERVAARVEEGLLHASFVVARRETVDGAGTERKVFLQGFPLRAELERIAAPRVGPEVFLIAKATNDAPVTLLQGPVSLFLGGEFVGRAHLPRVAAGDEVELAFGADDRVQVERKVLERFHDERGILFAKDELLRLRTRTTVKNLYGKPVKVKLLDRVPVSGDGDVTVTVLDGSTKPTEEGVKDRPGVRVHVLELAAKKEAAVDLAYEVRWPKGQVVSGLD